MEALLRRDLRPPARVVELGSAPGRRDRRDSPPRIPGDVGRPLAPQRTSGVAGLLGGSARFLLSPCVTHVEWDLERLPYPFDDGAFDAALMTEVLEAPQGVPGRVAEGDAEDSAAGRPTLSNDTERRLRGEADQVGDRAQRLYPIAGLDRRPPACAPCTGVHICGSGCALATRRLPNCRTPRASSACFERQDRRPGSSGKACRGRPLPVVVDVGPVDHPRSRESVAR